MMEPLSETGLSIVVPAYDEAERLPQTIERIAAYVESKPFTAEVLIVDDGSRDRTAQVVREAGRRWPDVILLQNPGNQGKGYSVRNGMLHASGRIALFTDADLSAPIEEADLLLEAIEAGNDIAIGSRGLRPELIDIHQSLFRETAGKIFNLVVRSVTGLPFKDTQCGFKAFRREAARAIFSRQQTVGFGFDVEVLYLAKKLGFRTAEIPVRWSHNEGTKISMFGDSIRMFTDVLRVRWMDLQGKYRS
jgi:glycosyltransferase involved in cell wall biosynthesis